MKPGPKKKTFAPRREMWQIRFDADSWGEIEATDLKDVLDLVGAAVLDAQGSRPTRDCFRSF